MHLNLLRFLALLFSAVCLVPTGAHLAQLLNKIHLPADEYLIVQQTYRGWALFGIPVVAAIGSTVVLATMLRSSRSFWLTLTALLCLAGAQVLFWVFTFPANQATESWTMLPPNWTDLRARWEYSHAAAAILNLGAVVALTASILRDD